MYRFHTTVHARPAVVSQGPTVDVQGARIVTARPASDFAETAFPRSFDDVQEALRQLPRMFLEPDGSFVWVGESADETWQVDGNLVDRGDRLHVAELKGHCPAGEFERLLRPLGWPATEVIFQLMRSAVFLEEADFRRCAAGAGAV
jgi:hypothetical protein